MSTGIVEQVQKRDNAIDGVHVGLFEKGIQTAAGK